jgi:tetratricopeptide (TPR) repeat protein
LSNDLVLHNKEFLALTKRTSRPSRDELEAAKAQYKDIIAAHSGSEYDTYIAEVAWASSNLGQICMDMGEFWEADEALQKSFAAFKRLNDQPYAAIVAVQLAQLAVQIGRQQEAVKHLEQSLSAYLNHYGDNSNSVRQSRKRLERFLRTGRISRLEEDEIVL